MVRTCRGLVALTDSVCWSLDCCNMCFAYLLCPVVLSKYRKGTYWVQITCYCTSKIHSFFALVNNPLPKSHIVNASSTTSPRRPSTSLIPTIQIELFPHRIWSRAPCGGSIMLLPCSSV